MKGGVGLLVYVLVACLYCRGADALLVTVSREEAEDALKQGREKGGQVTEYINRTYGFGAEDRFGENGVIRTKWSKLMVLAGLLSVSDRKPSEEELSSILTGTELQIDLHAFGDRMNFANAYTVYLIQSGRRIDPETIAVNDIVYSAGNGFAPSGFPKYRATIRSYFRYDTINSSDTAQILLVKNRKKVSFEVNFADYK